MKDYLCIFQISKHNLKAPVIADPYKGQNVSRLTKNGSIVLPCRNWTLHLLFYQIYFGDGSANSSKRIRQHYFGINKIQVFAFLNSHPIHSKSNPTFKNKAPLQPIVSQQIMERHQVDLVSFEKKMWLNLITNVICKF